MTGGRAIWIYAGLLVAALAVAIAASERAAPASLSASTHNPGPAGLRALYLYLETSGFDVMREETSLRQIRQDVKTLVISAPRLRRFEDAEITGVQTFVERGGALVYLAPRPFGAVQVELDRWLRLREGEWLHSAPFRVRDVSSGSSGATVELWLPFSSRAPRRLSVAGDRGVELASADALPIAMSSDAVYGWWRRMGAGEAFVFAGPDFAENSRIEEGDNLEAWVALAARGPMLFDESHHRTSRAATSDAARALWIVAAQFVACALVFSVARGTRLGPPRPEIIERHRSSREYLESIGWLTRRARVEPELLGEAMSRLRIAMQDRLGIPVSLPEVEAARALEERCQIRAARLLELCERVRTLVASPPISAVQFAQAAREFAQLERIISGGRRG
jgi:hypothetical protein